MAQGEDERNWNFVSFIVSAILGAHGGKVKIEDLNPYYERPEPIELNKENAKYIRSFFERIH